MSRFPPYGGDGSYSPRADRWLLPLTRKRRGRALRAADIGMSGEYRDEQGTRLVKWHRWPARCGRLSGKPMNGRFIVARTNLGLESARFYYADRVRCCGARARYDGSWLIARDTDGMVVAKMRVLCRSLQQQGRSK